MLGIVRPDLVDEGMMHTLTFSAGLVNGVFCLVFFHGAHDDSTML